jgi:hypothetical protein
MLKKLAATGAIAATVTGALMFSAPAYADLSSENEDSVLSGTQLNVPIVVCGNAINAVALLTSAEASCEIDRSFNSESKHKESVDVDIDD